MKDMFDIMFASGIIPELKAGNRKRKRLANKCAREDAPILGKPFTMLKRLYLELAFQVCTEESLDEIFIDGTAQQRWNLSEPLEQIRNGTLQITFKN